MTELLKNQEPLPKLLIAEDDGYASQMITQMLDDEFEIEQVNNGKDAVERCLTEDYIALLLDVGLPKMDGFDVIRTLREQKNPIAYLPIIVQSAHCDETDHAHLLELGANEVFTKPTQTDKLKYSIYKWHTKRTTQAT